MINDYIVKDSTVWQHSEYASLLKGRGGSIHVGIVREQVQLDDDDSSIRYSVEIQHKGRIIAVSCTLATRFGGIFNYEEVGLRPYASVAAGFGDVRTSYELMSGDVVIVAYINGDSREGVILGGLSHPGRTLQLDPGDVAYISEFNGIETSITAEGEYTLTFKGLPVNVELLDAPPDGTPLPDPEYDPIITGSYFGFDKTGSITISDADDALEQAITIDKSAHQITIDAGPELNITLDSTEGSFSLDGNSVDFSAEESFSIETLDFSVDADDSVKIKGNQIAIGSDGCELLDTIIQLIDLLGQVVYTSPVGPCNLGSAAPQWPQILQLKTQLQSIKGSL